MERILSNIELVVFDLGRVLIRICDDWQHACRCAKIPVPAQAPGPANQLKLLELTYRADTGELDTPAFCRSAAPLLGLSEQQVRALSDAFIRGPFPGAAELIEELAAANVLTACLSNTNENHWHLMGDAGSPVHLPLHRLRHRFASHLVGLRKPDPAIYHYVEQKTGVEPAAILFFDDVAENVQAATTRGWNAHQIDAALDDPIPQIRRVLDKWNVLAAKPAPKR